jgi:hypothetical protein
MWMCVVCSVVTQDGFRARRGYIIPHPSFIAYIHNLKHNKTKMRRYIWTRPVLPSESGLSSNWHKIQIVLLPGDFVSVCILYCWLFTWGSQLSFFVMFPSYLLQFLLFIVPYLSLTNLLMIVWLLYYSGPVCDEFLPDGLSSLQFFLFLVDHLSFVPFWSLLYHFWMSISNI